MATDLLEKVERLIALTASDNVNEARTAAFQACKLIREHKMQLSAPEQPRRVNPNRGGFTWKNIEVNFRPKPEPPPLRKFFCDGCKTEFPATWQRGQLKMCERCRDDFDRVVKEDEERRERERQPVHGPEWDVFTTLLDEMGKFNHLIGRRDSTKPFAREELNRLRAQMGFPPLSAEEYERSNIK